tara:strand:- start:1096 stop:1287 length:192 start_codon:yes stop_codon:yes gene_type:complete
MKKHIGKLVQIFPGDTCSKWGIIKSIDEFNIEVEITKVDRSDYELQPGDTMCWNRNKFSYKLA